MKNVKLGKGGNGEVIVRLEFGKPFHVSRLPFADRRFALTRKH
jgi:hypothetical protein